MTLENLFKPVTHKSESVSYRVPKAGFWPPNAITHSLDTPSFLDFPNGNQDLSVCMKCHPAPCVEYLPHEVELGGKGEGIPNNRPNQVCPTNAIVMGNNDCPEINMEICVHCQLCLIRCPVGALHWNLKDEIAYQDNLPNWLDEYTGERTEAENAASNWNKPLCESHISWEITENRIIKEITTFEQKLIDPSIVPQDGLKEEHYYPLARNYFREFGFKAAITKTGDTNFRIDGIVLSPFVMPIEIKAPAETKTIQVDATRQAVENAAFVESQFGLAVNPPSIVVGYHLPNERSAVKTSLVNVHSSYGVSVGVYTSGALLYLLLRSLEYRFHPVEDLERLFRTTLGSCDESVLKSFWADYMKQRLEVVVLGDKSEKVTELDNHFPHGDSYTSIQVSDLTAKWEQEIVTLEKLRLVLFPSK